MDGSRFERLREIVLEAAAAPPDERETILDRACGSDGELRDEALKLLEFDAGETPLDRPEGRSEAVGDLAPSIAAALSEAGHAPELAPGDRVGRFRILREIGRGGMAAVYLAERDDEQFEQRVALKLLHIGGRREIVSRFEQERQILASLTHPNIARLVDGGVTDNGQPYIVMELVEGRSIREYCDEGSLSVRERIELFLTVVRAVRHAHHNLVVHRDLKPSNILVTDEGEVKLLDFGIAKLLDPTPQPHVAPATRTFVRLMTPEYASPEQIRGEPVTTATDVYQLGLLLHELLTGHNPQRIAARSAAELERTVCDTEPPRASGAELTSADAETRRTTLSGLRKLLRGDLDNIIAKALQRTTGRRYSSTDQLLDDLERHLDGRPVSARPDTLGYRATSFARRHRVGVSVAVGLVVVLIAYGVTLTVQAGRIARERDRARLEATKAAEIRDFLVNLFEGSDPWQGGSEELTARELVDRGAERIDRALLDQPELRAEITAVVGDIYRRLGMFEEAAPLVARAAELTEEEFGPDSRETARAWTLLAMVERERGEYERAEELARKALAIRERDLGEADPASTEAMKVVAVLMSDQGKYEESLALHARSLELRRESGTEAQVAETLNLMASVYNQVGDPEASEAAIRESLEIRRRIFGERSIEYSTTVNSLGNLLKHQGDLEGAEEALREAVAVGKELLGERHPGVGTRMANLAAVLLGQDEFEEAEALYRDVLEIRKASLPENHPMVAAGYNDLGRALQDSGDLVAAEELYREAVNTLKAGYGDEHPWLSFFVYNLGSLLHERDDYDAALVRYEEALALDTRFVGAKHLRVARTYVMIGRLEEDRGRPDRAETAYREGLAILVEQRGEEHPETADVRARLEGLRP